VFVHDGGSQPFLLDGTLNTRKKFGGTLITNKTYKNSFILLIATKISSFSTKE